MKRKKSERKWSLLFLAIFVIIMLSAVLASVPFESRKTNGLEEIVPERNTAPYHAHADFLVVINGKELDFNKPEYSETHPGIHLHVRNYNGDKVLHIESNRAVLDDFFSSIDIEFDQECFSFIDGNAYCNDGTHILRFFVNGKKNNFYGEYKPKDLDKLLIIYGNETEDQAKEWTDAVSNAACVFSLKCNPPAEAENSIIYN